MADELVDQKTSAARSDPALEQRLLLEAPKAWAQLDGFYANVRISSTQRKRGSSGKRPDRSASNEVAVLGNSIRKIERGPAADAVERVLARNDRYAFALQRKQAPPGSPYAIDWLEKLGANDALDRRVSNYDVVFRGLVTGSWKIGGKTILEWKQSPGFQLNSVSSAAPAASGLVRVEFAGMDLFPDSVDGKDLRGHVLYDPAHYWIIREAQVEFANRVVRSTVREYGAERGGIPVATKITTKEFASSNQLYSEGSTTIDKTTFGDVSPNDFRLSYFGIPEPDFDSRTAWLRWWPYVSGAILCFLVP